VLRACGGLDGKHPLMSELVRSCAGEGSFLRATADLQRCTNSDTCSEAYMAQKTALRGMAAADMRADRAVRATALPPACKRVLITPDSSYAAFGRVEAVLQKIINALESRSRRDRLRAARAARSFKAPSRSTQRQLDQFRVNCR
jgi:hypothetical protein